MTSDNTTINETVPELPELLEIPTGKRDQAIRLLGIIQTFERFAATRPEASRKEMIRLFVVGRPDCRIRSLERWMALYKQNGLAGLVDKRGGCNNASNVKGFSPEAWEYFKSMYLTPSQLSIKHCWLTLSALNRADEKGWIIPPLAWTQRYVKKTIPFPVLVLYREGLAAYQAKCAPFIQRDPDSVEPGQVWVGDHHQFNCWVRDRGRWLRPWITAWMDMRSRLITGRTISAGPNQSTILTAMKRGIDRCGPPDSVKIDNGRDYDSEAWTGTTKVRRRAAAKGYIDEQFVAGIYAMMDIGISFAQPYRPQSKPIERWFDTLDCQLTKTIPTYCGKDIKRKPEDLPDMLKSDKALAEAYSMAEFTELADRYIEVYNNTAHTGAGMDGMSPAQVMAKRESVRMLAPGVADLLLRVWSGERTVGKNGVQCNNLLYGEYDMTLMMHQGKKVRVSYDPDDVSEVYVYENVSLKLLCIAKQNQLVAHGPVGEADLRIAKRKQAQAKRITKLYRNSRLAAAMDLPTLAIAGMQEQAREKPEVEQPSTIRLVHTAMDGQVADHQRQKMQKAVRMAAGAEDTQTVPDLDFDFSRAKHVNPYDSIKLFDE